MPDSFGIGARCLADIERPVDAEDVAAFERGGRGDAREFAKWREGIRERFGFGLARLCA